MENTVEFWLTKAAAYEAAGELEKAAHCLAQAMAIEAAS